MHDAEQQLPARCQQDADPYQDFAKIVASTPQPTDLELVDPGTNTLTTGGLEFAQNALGESSGAGIIVIYDDSSVPADIQIVDGVDIAFEGFGGLLETTVPQNFVIAPAAENRIGEIVVFVGSVGEGRSSIVRIEVEGVVTDHLNVLASQAGPLWDAIVLPVEIPSEAATRSTRFSRWQCRYQPKAKNRP